MTCRWCKGTGLYQPLTGPSEPCRECQVVASERTLPLADNSMLATSTQLEAWLNAKYGPIGAAKIGEVIHLKKPQRYTSVALRINDTLKEYLELNSLIGPPYPSTD